MRLSHSLNIAGYGFATFKNELLTKYYNQN